MSEYRKDVKQYNPTAGTDIGVVITDCIILCIKEQSPYELVHNDIRIVVFPYSSLLDIYKEWDRQREKMHEYFQLGLNSK